MDSQTNTQHTCAMTMRAMSRLSLPLVGAVLLCACSTSRRAAVGVQYVRAENDRGALGLSCYALGDEQEPLAWFFDVHASSQGAANGVRYSQEPPAASTHPVTDTAEFRGSLHLGPCVRLVDRLHAYAGVGFGYSQRTIERFDASLGLSPDGYYSYSENPSVQGSATAGLLVEPAENFLLGVGWDVYFDGVVFTAAFAF